jgi:6-phosphogluconolactonase
LLFSGDGHFAYVINELGNTLVSFKYDKGRFTEIMSVSTLPEDFEGESYAAAIRFSSDGKYLFTSNRGKDSIACFRVLPDGKFELMEIVDSHGKYPRDISFLQDGKHFAAANEHSGRIAFFEHESGKLKYLPDWDITKYPRPLCIFNHRPKL